MDTPPSEESPARSAVATAISVLAGSLGVLHLGFTVWALATVPEEVSVGEAMLNGGVVVSAFGTAVFGIRRHPWARWWFLAWIASIALASVSNVTREEFAETWPGTVLLGLFALAGFYALTFRTPRKN